MNTKTAALLIGVVFIIVGILGFFPNPIIGACDNSVIFCTDKVHNAVHIISGVLFVLVALTSAANAGLVMKIFGIVYLGLGIYGLIAIGSSGMGNLLGFLHVNGADNYLHIGLGVVIFLAGMLPNLRAAAR